MSDNGSSKVPSSQSSADPLDQYFYALGDGKDPFLVLLGRDGIPHRTRGLPPLLRDQDPEYRQPQTGGQLHGAVFDLGVEEQRAAYERTLSRVYTLQLRGAAKICVVDRRFVESRGTWLVYCEWLELFTYDAPGTNPETSRILWRRD